MTDESGAGRTPVRSLVTWLRRLVGAGYAAWRDDRVIRLGAGLAYYSLFAIVPVLSVAVAVAGIVVSEADLQRYLAERLAQVFDTDADSVAVRLAGAIDASVTSTGLGLLGLGSLLLAASLVFVALQDALNTIWHVPVRAGVKHSLVRRVAAFGFVIGVGGYLVVSLSVHTLTNVIENWIPADLSALGPLYDLLDGAASWALGILVVSVLFRLLPDAHVPWRAALTGAAVTTVLLVLGTFVISVYLREVGSGSVAGALGGVLLVLTWIYYEMQIVLVGAVLTKVLTDVGPPWRSGRASPRRGAALGEA